MRSKVTNSLIAQGVPAPQRPSRHRQCPSPSPDGSIASIPHFIRLDFAYATRTVLYVMAAIMAVAAVVGLLGLRRGVQAESDDAGADPALGTPA